MTAELVAIKEALNEIEKKAVRKDKIVILTDSLAASISLKNHNKAQATKDLTEEITEKNSPTQTPKGYYNTNLLDPSTFRNRRQRKS